MNTAESDSPPTPAAADGVPPPDTYPTGTVGVAREWDGHAWAEQIIPDASAPELPWQRKPLRFLARPYFWIWFVPLAVATGIAFLAVRNDAARLLVGAGLAAMAGPCIAFVLFLRRRNLWQQAIRTRAVFGWGSVAGIVSVIVAALIETPFLAYFKGWEAEFIAGPVEETSKLLIPVILYLVGARRDPRAGFAIAVVGATLFGFIEGFLKIAGPALAASHQTLPALAPHPFSLPELVVGSTAPIFYTVGTPASELLHPVLTGFIVAAAWRSGWVRRRFWPVLIGTWAIASTVHSLGDVALGYSATHSAEIQGIVIIASILLPLLWYLLLMRGSARQLPSPTVTAQNPPPWRPKLPRA